MCHIYIGGLTWPHTIQTSVVQPRRKEGRKEGRKEQTNERKEDLAGYVRIYSIFYIYVSTRTWPQSLHYSIAVILSRSSSSVPCFWLGCYVFCVCCGFLLCCVVLCLLDVLVDWLVADETNSMQSRCVGVSVCRCVGVSVNVVCGSVVVIIMPYGNQRLAAAGKQFQRAAGSGF